MVAIMTLLIIITRTMIEPLLPGNLTAAVTLISAVATTIPRNTLSRRAYLARNASSPILSKSRTP